MTQSAIHARLLAIHAAMPDQTRSVEGAVEALVSHPDGHMVCTDSPVSDVLDALHATASFATEIAGRRGEPFLWMVDYNGAKSFHALRHYAESEASVIGECATITPLYR